MSSSRLAVVAHPGPRGWLERWPSMGILPWGLGGVTAHGLFSISLGDPCPLPSRGIQPPSLYGLGDSVWLPGPGEQAMSASALTSVALNITPKIRLACGMTPGPPGLSLHSHLSCSPPPGPSLASRPLPGTSEHNRPVISRKSPRHEWACHPLWQRALSRERDPASPRGSPASYLGPWALPHVPLCPAHTSAPGRLAMPGAAAGGVLRWLRGRPVSGSHQDLRESVSISHGSHGLRGLYSLVPHLPDGSSTGRPGGLTVSLPCPSGALASPGLHAAWGGGWEEPPAREGLECGGPREPRDQVRGLSTEAEGQAKGLGSRRARGEGQWYGRPVPSTHGPAVPAAPDPHSLSAVLPFPRLEFPHCLASLPTAIGPTHGPSGAARLLPGRAGRALMRIAWTSIVQKDTGLESAGLA